MADDNENMEETLGLTPCLGVQQVYTDYKYLTEQVVNGTILSHQQAVELLTLTYGPFSEFGMFEVDEGDDDAETPTKPLEDLWGH